jgi:hypothetical protein
VGRIAKVTSQEAQKDLQEFEFPPAKGFKTEVKSDGKETQGKREASLGRKGGGRALSETPN